MKKFLYDLWWEHIKYSLKSPVISFAFEVRKITLYDKLFKEKGLFAVINEHARYEKELKLKAEEFFKKDQNK